MKHSVIIKEILKMTNNTKKLLITTIFLAALLLSSVYAALLPSAHAQKVAASTAKGLTIINQVAGVNLTKYNASSTLDVAGSYLDVLPTEEIQYTLQGDGSLMEVADTFTNGSLQIMDVLENVGSPHVTASASLVNPISFLLNYQAYSANSFYGQLASMLKNADPSKNSTTIVGNVKFEITTTTGNSRLGNCTTFTWSYTSNGVDADCKSVSLSYQNGFLNCFMDTWNLYPIGSTTVNLSEQQAEAIAMRTAKTCSGL
jgi:hypothetical protein